MAFHEHCAGRAGLACSNEMGQKPLPSSPWYWLPISLTARKMRLCTSCWSSPIANLAACVVGLRPGFLPTHSSSQAHQLVGNEWPTFQFSCSGASLRNRLNSHHSESSEPSGAPASQVICRSWNKGRCSAQSPLCCFAHCCSLCGASHRFIDSFRHAETQDKGECKHNLHPQHQLIMLAQKLGVSKDCVFFVRLPFASPLLGNVAVPWPNQRTKTSSKYRDNHLCEWIHIHWYS